ncbi:MAG: radical SAM protein [Armatimonadetes bacterium]|nr:radical SAM protein [Armatimonadota bacterium]MDW8027835.1 radical SAM protein [Armatimonadota bacterium]
MAKELATEQLLTVEQGFEEKVRRIDEILQSLSDEEMRKFALFFERQLDFHKRPQIVEMELIITYRCNLACDYCFMRKQNLCMDKETALKAIEFLLLFSKEHPFVNVTFFGGEPLLYLGLMEEVAEYVTERAKQMGKKVHFACTTNGTLLSEKALDFARSFGFLYLLSLDGSKQTHDLHRKFENGMGSFEFIASKLPLLKRKQGWLGARVTVTPETIGQLAEGVKELFEMGINQFLIGLVHEAEWDEEALKEIER